MHKLVISDDEGKQTVVPLVRDELTIGRKEGNTIRLTDRNVSRRHAKLRRLNGTYVLEDLQSYNGVKVNGRRIGGEIQLKTGDQVLIGDYSIQLKLEDEGASEEKTAPRTDPGTTDAPVARLVMTSSPAPGAEYALSRAVMKIGRAEELDVWVNHRSISREHAEISVDGETLRIKDLGSANGVRVNGKDVRETEIKPGDLIELGQVRFRVVAPGEVFAVDPEGDAPAEPPPAANRTPVLVATGILLAAIAGAAAIALWDPSAGAGEPQTPEVIEPLTHIPEPPRPEVEPGPGAHPGALPSGPVRTPGAPPPGPDEAAVEALVEACNSALAAGSFETALMHANEALAAQPDHQGAATCRAAVEDQQAEAEAFANGVRLYAAGDIEGAYLAFEGLPTESSYRQRPEVTQAMFEFAELTLHRAVEQLEANPAEAQRLAQMVLAMSQIGPDQRRVAEAALRRASQRMAATSPRGPGTREAAPREGDPRAPREPNETREPGTRETAPRETAPRETAPREVARPPTPPPTRPTPPEPERLPPLQEARACLARSDNACAVQALEGRARSAAELQLLIETYRAMGNSPRMLDTMERFVDQFPDHARAESYRNTLRAQGRRP